MNKNVVIRPVHPTDAADLYAIVSDPRVARTLLQLPSMELHETQEWVSKSDINRHRLVAEIDGRVVGQISLTQSTNPRRRHSGAVGMMVHPDYWRQGIGRTLMAGILDIADNWLNLLRVQLEVMTHNTAAIALYEKFGFVREGVRRMAVFADGKYQDELLMSRLHNPTGLKASTTLPPPPDYFRPEVKQFTVRTFHPADISDLFEIIRDPYVARTIAQIPSMEFTRLEERLAAKIPERHRFVVDADGKVVGEAHLYTHKNRRTAHVGGLGMHVHPAYWGLGVGSRLMTALVDLADNWLNLRRMELEVNTDNPAGVHLYQKFGFEIEGIIRFHLYGAGRWADSYFMSRLKNN